MEPADVSGTVTISDQRSYNTLDGKSALSESCGEFSVYHSTVSRWVNCFRGGCMSTDKDPRQ